jgi:hypothetical protein
MSWKKAVFFGGALLVLAACGDATGPTSPSALSRTGGNSAALTASPMPTTTTTTTTTLLQPSTNPILCSGIVIHVGLDGSIISDCGSLE